MSMWRCTLGTMGIAVIMGGCANHAAPVSTVPTAAEFPFDGSYAGTVKLTGVASGGELKWCKTDPTINLSVAHGLFSYTQAHPNIPFTSGTGDTTAVYSANIEMDGSVHGQSNRGGAIFGTAAGSHISGRIDGVGCFYTFSADKT